MFDKKNSSYPPQAKLVWIEHQKEDITLHVNNVTCHWNSES